MATERELKTMQEERLYDIFLLQKMLRNGSAQTDVFLASMGERAQSGMTAEEIDAVRERVSRTLESQQ